VRAARRRGSVRRLEGVLNGTANFVLDRQARGTAFDVALRIAQELGFAEADPRADLDGADAARKLAILAGAAFGREVDPTQVHCVPLHEAPCPQDAAADGCVVRMVARAELNADGTLTIEVSPRRLGADHPLAAARDEGNVLQVYTDAGLLQTSGRGAGRWPTVEAVLGDLHACARRPTRPRVDAGAADGAAVSDDSDEVAA